MTQKKKKGTIRGRLSDGTPNPIDRYVGTRVRLRRCMLGLSQERLAEELGITFQQVQKYEKGLNRIGASRLWDLAQVLGVSVDFFFDKMDEVSQNSSPRNISGFRLSDVDDLPFISPDILSRRDVIELIRYYTQITNPKISHNVLELIKSLSSIDDMYNYSIDDTCTDFGDDQIIQYQPYPKNGIDDKRD